MLAADMGGDLCFRSRFFRRNTLPPPSPSSLRVHARPAHLLDETNVIAVHLSKLAVNGRRTH